MRGHRPLNRLIRVNYIALIFISGMERHGAARIVTSFMIRCGGSCIANPDGEIVATAKTEDDELVIHDCDLDDTKFNKETIFDFKRHRRTEHYGRITGQVGVTLPPEA